jgi:hypothetical protein
MIDHNYKIVTREVVMTPSGARHFIAELSDVYMIINGEPTKAQCPQIEFCGNTHTAAVINASDTVRKWLLNQSLKFSSGEDCAALSS